MTTLIDLPSHFTTNGNPHHHMVVTGDGHIHHVYPDTKHGNTTDRWMCETIDTQHPHRQPRFKRGMTTAQLRKHIIAHP